MIIPALNEESNIHQTIRAILDQDSQVAIQIIVVDNGSTDRTRELARQLGAMVIHAPRATIAELRNLGAKQAEYEILAFIDADVSLEKSWATNLQNFINCHETTSLWITGSRCITDQPHNYLNRFWFSRLSEIDSKKEKYINSGHLITTRELFKKISGFNSSLITSEDVDFCTRAKQENAKILPKKELIAYHRGYPKSVLDFIRREAWHGRQDFQSFQLFMKSKVAMIAFINLIAIFSAISLSIFFSSTTPFVFYLIFFAFISTLISLKKFGSTPLKAAASSSLIAALYITGRTISPLLKVSRHRSKGN